LIDLVEHRDTALKESFTVDGEFNTPRTSIEQAHIIGVLEICDQLRDSWLGDAKLGRRFRHALVLGHCQKDKQVVQPYTAAQLTIWKEFGPRHRFHPIRVEQDW
jgi:hypothetical protein